MTKHYRQETNCLNCGTEVKDKFCPHCGQENLELHEPFWHFISHSVGHYFHFDSKFFNTVKPLLTQPGKITLAYVAGKRTRFLQPVSMYIFVSIIYFLMISLVEPKPGAMITIQEDLEEAENNKKQVAQLQKANLPISKNLSDTIVKTVSRSASVRMFEKLNFNRQAKVLDSVRKVNGFDEVLLKRYQKIHDAREDSTYAAYINHQKRLPAEEQDNALEKYLVRKSFLINPKDGKREDFSGFSEKYKSKVYFIMMPLFAFFLMLNFRKNKRFYIDHMVFTLHVFTAFFLMQLVFVPLAHVVGETVGDYIELISTLLLLFYTYKALRVFYERSRWVTIRKMFILSIMLLFSFSIGEFLVGSFVLLTA